MNALSRVLGKVVWNGDMSNGQKDWWQLISLRSASLVLKVGRRRFDKSSFAIFFCKLDRLANKLVFVNGMPGSINIFGV